MERTKLYIKSDFTRVSFGECSGRVEFCTVSDVFGEDDPEAGGSNWEGSVAPGSGLGSVCWGEEVCVGGAEGTGRVVVVE